MQAVEFKTIIQDGIIKLPDLEELSAGTEVKVIVMWADSSNTQMADEQEDMDLSPVEITDFSFTPGNAHSNEKPSDFAGIWKNRKKINAKKLRQRAWARRK